VSQEEATTLRRGESGLFFYDLLKQKLQELNSEFITPELADDVIRRLESVRNNIEGQFRNSCVAPWRAFRFFVEAEKRHRNVKLIEFTDAGQKRFSTSPRNGNTPTGATPTGWTMSS